MPALTRAISPNSPTSETVMTLAPHACLGGTGADPVSAACATFYRSARPDEERTRRDRRGW
jgi:hypothetical protein